MLYRVIQTLSLFSVPLFFSPVADAQILSVTGAMTVAPLPANVSVGNFESDTNIFIFPERQNFVLPSSVVLNRGGGSAIFNGEQTANVNIGAGNRVSSYLIHLDSVRTNTIRLQGTVTFAQPIRGLMYRDASLNASDTVLGVSGTIYGGVDRQLEVEDTVEIVGNTLRFDIGTTPVSDEIRVITAVAVTISGRITLESCVNSAQPIEFTFTAVDGSFFNRTTTLNSSGNYTLSGITSRLYTVSIKGAKWLSKNITVDARGGDITNANAVLLAGDGNNDNVVDVADLLLIINSYNQQKNIPANNPRYMEATDFNCDDVNDVADLLLVIGNYNKQGNS